MSGGQSEIEASKNLNEINKINDTNFLITFSYGRGLQASALKAFGKNQNNQRSLKYERIYYENKLDQSKNLVIKKGKFNLKKPIRVRVVTTNIKNLSNYKREPKVKLSLRYLSRFSNFVLIVINNKKKDKIEGENVILRYYGIGAQIIKDLKIKNMILVTRTRKKIIGLEGFGLKIKKQEILR